MSEVSESLVHPVLGRLEWRSGEEQWFTRYQLPSGGLLDVAISPYHTDRHAFVARAAELFQWALDNERAMLFEAITAYLLSLYNDGWRQEGEPILSAAEFSDQMELQFLIITANSIVPVEFWYDPGALYESFGGHVVSVQVSAGLKYRGAHLVG